MRIVFIGSVEFSKKALQKLIDLKAEIVGVCTKESSKFNSDFANLIPICKKNKIPFHLTKDINSEISFNWIKSLNADIIFCFGWSNLLKKNILNLTPMGVLGFHPTKLPQNRGRHPLIWALALGLKKSASTFFFMDEGADSGDILSQKDFDISHNDDAKTLYDKVVEIALEQIAQFFPSLKKNNYKTIVQNNENNNNWRKRAISDGKIDFRMSSLAIYNLVRALTKPYVGAHVQYGEREVKIWKVKIIENSLNNFESGKILNVNENKILVKTYDSAIELVDHEFIDLPKIGEYL